MNICTKDMEEILSILFDDEVDLTKLVREIAVINPILVIEANKNLKMKALMSEPWVKEAIPFIKSGDKVSAIKVCRKHTDSLLVDAARMVRELVAKMGLDYNNLTGERHAMQ